MKGFMTTKQAADYLGYDPDYICMLCANGKLLGAEKFSGVWSIPEQSVWGYTPAPQGFAVVKARKQAEKALRQAELNKLIAQGGGAMYEKDAEQR